MTRFWNKLHKVCSQSKDWKAKTIAAVENHI